MTGVQTCALPICMTDVDEIIIPRAGTLAADIVEKANGRLDVPDALDRKSVE